MTQLNTSIILCKDINLDKSYKNVLNYSLNDMLSLINSNTHKIAESTHYSFIKHGANSIKVDFNYQTCMQANYIAFKNTDYLDKWFFAFIESIEYINDGTTRINFIVDAWTTFFRDLTIKPCFVIREHVNDDTIGAHTIPEGLETGDYISNQHLADSVNNDYTIIIGVSEDYLNNYNFGMNYYNGIPAPLFYYRYDNASVIKDILKALALAGKTDSIITMFIAPKWLAPYQDTSVRVATSNNVATTELGISRISTLNGYTPKNNKLLCYPYVYIALSNVTGQYNVLKQEVWELDENNEMVVQLIGSLVSGCSIKAVPINYNGTGVALDDAITIGKYPQLAWPNDLYTNWLTQNGVNILGITLNKEQAGLIGGSVQALWGAYSGNVASIGSGIGAMFETMNESYRKDIIPTGVEGSLNSGDVINASHSNRLHCYKMTIKREYAEVIDDFFTHFGYKITKVKTPNITGRRYFNFIQIGESEEIGYGSIPNEYLDTINTICRAGVTIWHSHDNIGNYALNNDII